MTAPKGLLAGAKTVIDNQLLHFYNGNTAKTSRYPLIFAGKNMENMATCLSRFRPFFSVKLWTACKPSNEARGGDIHWSHAINYCSKINIFQHWRLVINQITPTHLWNAFASLVHWFIHFLSAMSGLSSVSNSYTSPPRSLWDSFMARRLEDSQRWELPLTQSQLNKGYPCRIKVHICHLDISPSPQVDTSSVPVGTLIGPFCVHRCPGHFTHRHLWLSSKHFGQCVSSWPGKLPRCVSKWGKPPKKRTEMIAVVL